MHGVVGGKLSVWGLAAPIFVRGSQGYGTDIRPSDTRYTYEVPACGGYSDAFHRVNPDLNQGLTVCISRKRGRVWSENIKPFLLISGESGMNLVHHVDF